jgi:hypothetical protein
VYLVENEQDGLRKCVDRLNESSLIFRLSTIIVLSERRTPHLIYCCIELGIMREFTGGEVSAVD